MYLRSSPVRRKANRSKNEMALPNYKDIVELLKKRATIEAQEKIMELREAALALQEENISLKNQVMDLQI